MPTPYERFLERFWADIDAGSLRPVEAYLGEFPECEEEIRSEHSAQLTAAAHQADGAGTRASPTEEVLKKLASSPRLDGQRYVIEAEIGRGGFGTVFRVVDQNLGRKLAMKVASEHESPHGVVGDRLLRQLLSRFLDEAQITSQLDHPGVVPVHELGLDSDGRVAFTMRLVRGRTLDLAFSDARAGRDGWSTTRAIEVLLKVCDTVAFAHSKGVLHRDLKPSNVMVGRYGELYVMDWGLAKVVGQPDGHDLRIVPESESAHLEADSVRGNRGVDDAGASVWTMDGQRLGTPSYMSLEQARGESVDARTDVASLGAMLYEVLTGRAPHTAPDVRRRAYQVLQDLLAGPPQPVHELAPNVPAELVAICEKAMARDRSGRYASIADLAADLRAYLDQRVVRAYRTGAIAEMRAWVRRNKPLATSLVAAVLFLVAGIVGISSMTLEASKQRELADQRATRLAQLVGLETAARTAAQSHLDRFNMLADVVNLRELKAAEAQLYPAFPERVPAMEQWLERTRNLVARTEMVRRGRDEILASVLAALPVASRPASPSGSAEHELASQVAACLPQEDPRRFLLETLDKLVEDMVVFAQTEVRSVERRLSEARAIRKLSIEDHRAAWDAAIAAIAVEPKYHGLRLVPQLGLVPIGVDPESRLWEFGHVPSGMLAKRHPRLQKLAIRDETGIVFVLLPAGKFWMGAQQTDPNGRNYAPGAESDESPVCEVGLRAFFLSKYEMTRGQWAKLSGGATPSFHKIGVRGGGDPPISASHPVENVSWQMCSEMMARNGLVLPTEAQWEYGCRAGSTTIWCPGDRVADLAPFANLRDRKAAENMPGWGVGEEFRDGFTGPAPVGGLKANPFGLHDMHGNINEWCRDRFCNHGGPRDPSDGLSLARGGEGGRSTRGGSFGSLAAHARSAHRYPFPEWHRNDSLGLRPARIVSE